MEKTSDRISNGSHMSGPDHSIGAYICESQGRIVPPQHLPLPDQPGGQTKGAVEEAQDGRDLVSVSPMGRLRQWLDLHTQSHARWSSELIVWKPC